MEITGYAVNISDKQISDRYAVRKQSFGLISDVCHFNEERSLNLDNPYQNIVEILFLTKLVESKKEAKRVIEQGGVSVDGNKISSINDTIDFSEQKLIKVGKRKFIKVTA